MKTSRSIYVRRDRLAGGLWGLLIGNAVGVPYTHRDREDQPASENFDFEPPASFPRSNPHIAPRTWAVEGAQALCLLMALQFPEQFELDGLTKRVIDWAQLGLCSVDSNYLVDDPDTGALVRAMEGRPAAAPPRHYDRAYERGALLRIVPLVLCHLGSEAELLSTIAKLSSPLSEHRLTTAASMMYALWARAELDARDDPWIRASERLRELGPELGLNLLDIEQVLALEHEAHVPGRTDAISTLSSAYAAVHATDSFAGAVQAAVARGYDTDLTAAATGGIAGLRYGMYGIPDSWRERLRGKEMLENELMALLAQATPREPKGTGKARSSRTDPLRIGTIELANGGKIGITFCPGKKQPFAQTGSWNRNLDTDLEAIKAWGATHLVTLIAPWEFVDLDVIALPKRAKAHGLIWHHAPILDGHAPDILPEGFTPEEWFEAKWPIILPELHAALDRNEGVVVHCKGGLGRAGTVAALLLALRDPTLSAEEVIRRIRKARPNAIETVAQEHYLARRLL